ncbi:ABC transporter ATP-binding protein, partial [bacterium]|nr:ABC transporter ATP-binding protein [bacterium]
KEEKRSEAEERNRKYKSRKEIDAKIENTESELEKLMKEESDLLEELADPATYQQADRAKQLNERYITVKKLIEELSAVWDELSAEREQWL